MKPLLSLCMIVKDEAASLRGVLEAVKPYIDTYTILDTGSTDSTKDIVLEVLGDVPGALLHGPFVDFATARNRVLELDAQQDDPPEFSLMLSGDEYLSGGEKLREFLETKRTMEAPSTDIFQVRVTLDEATLCSLRVFRTGSEWRYVGKVHEAETHPNPNAPIEFIPDVLINHVVADPMKRLMNIWENHIPVLEEELENDPTNDRTLVFLAQSYNSMLPYMNDGERLTTAMKAMSLYMRRLAIPTGNEVERNYCKMQFLDNARITHLYTDAELYTRTKELFENDPHRPEVAMMFTNAAIKVLPTIQVYQIAATTTSIAEAAKNVSNSTPVTLSIAWRAHYVAAKCAKQMATKYPNTDIGNGKTWEMLLTQHIEQGIKEGGARDLFEKINAPVEVAAVAEAVPMVVGAPEGTTDGASA